MSRSAAVGGAVGFFLGGLLVLVMARESSDVFMTNRLALAPHELAAQSRQLFQSGDLAGAQRMLRAQAAASTLASARQVSTSKWDLTYPLSAWLVGKITDGMNSSNDAGLPMALAIIDAQIALVMEREGKIDEGAELLEQAARNVSTDPGKLRQAAQEALGI